MELMRKNLMNNFNIQLTLNYMILMRINIICIYSMDFLEDLCYPGLLRLIRYQYLVNRSLMVYKDFLFYITYHILFRSLQKLINNPFSIVLKNPLNNRWTDHNMFLNLNLIYQYGCLRIILPQLNLVMSAGLICDMVPD